MRISSTLISACCLMVCLGCSGRADKTAMHLQSRELKSRCAEIKRDTPLVDAISGMDKIWLLENTRQIPTGASARKLFAIGDEGADEFLLFSLSGSAGQAMTLDDLKILFVSDPLKTSNRSILIHQANWVTVKNGRFVNINLEQGRVSD